MKTRVLAGQGGHTTAQVVNQVVHVEGAGSVMKGGVVIGIVRQALEKGVQVGNTCNHQTLYTAENCSACRIQCEGPWFPFQLTDLLTLYLKSTPSGFILVLIVVLMRLKLLCSNAVHNI